MFQATYARRSRIPVACARLSRSIDARSGAGRAMPRCITTSRLRPKPRACPGKRARAEQAALALEPPNPAAANGLGLLQIRAGKPADAIASFEQAVKVGSDQRHVLDESRQRAP